MTMSTTTLEKSEDVEGQTTPSPKDTTGKLEFPEGGSQGWLVVLGCFCVMFFTFGYVNAFG
jgi:hypothetical protein